MQRLSLVDTTRPPPRRPRSPTPAEAPRAAAVLLSGLQRSVGARAALSPRHVSRVARGADSSLLVTWAACGGGAGVLVWGPAGEASGVKRGVRRAGARAANGGYQVFALVGEEGACDDGAGMLVKEVVERCDAVGVRCCVVVGKGEEEFWREWGFDGVGKVKKARSLRVLVREPCLRVW